MIIYYDIILLSILLGILYEKKDRYKEHLVQLSLTHKFIISTVTIATVSLSLILFVNFSSMNKLQHTLIDEQIKTTSKLVEELVRPPLIISDSIRLDAVVKNLAHIKNIVMATVLSDQSKFLSHFSSKKEFSPSTNLNQLSFNNRAFRSENIPIKHNNIILGSVQILFELTDTMNAIKQNQEKTYTFIFLEIILIFFVAYAVGSLLTQPLSRLTSLAEKIVATEETIVFHENYRDKETSVLSKALSTMQQRIAEQSSKLKESSHKLKKERDFHSSVIDAASSVIVIMDKEGKVLKVNHAVENVTGYTQEELVGKVSWELFTPQNSHNGIKQHFYALTAGDYPNTYENVWIVKDGTTRPFTWSNSCMLNDSGDIQYIISIGTDITDKEKADQTIRTLINSPTDSMMLLSTAGTILEINEVGAKRLGSTVADLKGEDIFSYTPEDIIESRSGYFYEAIVTKKPIVFEDTRSGHILENHLYPILNKNNNIHQLAIFSRDVTEFRKTEKELQTYIDLVNENVITSRTDLKGIITHVSEAFCTISGYSREELIGKPHKIVRHPDESKEIYTQMWKTIKQGLTWRGELKNRKKNGDDYWVDVTIYPSFNDQKDIVGYHAIRQDITNKKIIEDLSIKDPLTGLFNRRHFDTLFEQELNRAKRDKKIFCLMLCDVDNFKLYNDTYGHPMGDTALKEIGNVFLEHHKRASDFPFRLGGEEFGSIFTVTDFNIGYNLAQKICEAIKDKKILHEKNTPLKYITASFGVTYIDFNKDPESPFTQAILYQYADRLLYQAKESGRNKVIMKKCDTNLAT